MKKLLLGLFVSLLLSVIPASVLAHGGVQHNTDDGVITIYQTPLSAVVRESVATSFTFADKEGHRLKNIPVKLTLTDTYFGDSSKDKEVLTKDFKTDPNGTIQFSYRYPKPDYYDLDLDFDINGKPQEGGYLVSVRNPYKNWYSLTYILVLGLGVSLGWLLFHKKDHRLHDKA